MARRYTIQTPDGKAITVEAPEDATDEQLIAFARAQIGGKYDRNPIDLRKDTPPVEPPASAPNDSALEGFIGGAMKPIDNAASWIASTGVGQAIDEFGQSLGFPSTQEAVNSNQQMRDNNTRTGWQMAGNIASTLPLARLPGGAFSQGAASGALLSDEGDAYGVGKDAIVGGALGKASELAFRGVAQAVSPHLDAGVQRLIQAGVPLTPGQIFGQGGAFGRGVKRVEDTLATMPIVGSVVGGAQRRSVEGLNRAATQRALTPIGENLPANLAPGHETVAYAGDRLRAAYGDVLPRLRGTLDNTFQTRVQAVERRANLPAEYQQQLAQVRAELGNAFQRAGPNGAYNGRTLRDASERLEDLASGWRRSDDPYLRVVGDVAEQYRQQLHALARRQNPRDANRLRDIDRGYASLVRVEKAALNSDDGVFSPAAYKAATRTADRSARRRATARGQALDQDLSRDGAQIVSNTAAQGGSKDVNSLAVLGALGLGALGGKPAALATVGAAGLGSAAYTPVGTAVVRDVFARQNYTSPQIAQLLRYGAAAAPVASPALIEQGR